MTIQSKGTVGKIGEHLAYAGLNLAAIGGLCCLGVMIIGVLQNNSHLSLIGLGSLCGTGTVAMAMIVGGNALSLHSRKIEAKVLASKKASILTKRIPVAQQILNLKNV